MGGLGWVLRGVVVVWCGTVRSGVVWWVAVVLLTGERLRAASILAPSECGESRGNAVCRAGWGWMKISWECGAQGVR